MQHVSTPKPLTAKVLLIGDSSVGKTSLRQSYLHNNFHLSYKATIGADFVTKTLPVKEDAHEKVSLQIWDTAGQERFRSLGAAFYRGADAVILTFSIIDRKSLKHLADWFAEFKARCPIEDGQEAEMTWVCVATKLDLQYSQADQEVVTQDEAQRMINELLPIQSTSKELNDTSSWDHDEEDETPTAREEATDEFPLPVAKPPHYSVQDVLDESDRRPRILSRASTNGLTEEEDGIENEEANTTTSIDIITPSGFHKRRRSHSRTGGGRSIATTTTSIYHTPSASITNQSFTSTLKLSSPPLPPADLDDWDEPPTPRPLEKEPTQQNGYLDSNESIADSIDRDVEPVQPFSGIKLFFTSAKTGEHVAEPFEWCANHIHERVKYAKWKQAQKLHRHSWASGMFQYPSNVRREGDGPVKVGAPDSTAKRKWLNTSGCCG